MKQARIVLLAAMTGLAVLTTAGCSVARDQTTVGGYVDDKVTTARVKAKLLEDRTTGGMSINVDTLDGIVALSGFAKSPSEKAQAEALARTTPGVRQVVNNLIVRP
ncbi:BON domain-containing protein [Ramlibacter rhizophilus]|uniref:BON domain-containing protein n=1 Tax=Ramlibacter rhizophilus TaxID=1781167 RepID=A0A4Z0BQ89_9BURK|nr:BON domain-containing protein [Ramlibacter rhizophilus]TFZ01486.1 BON domain-containing protein [Ramlibacter rhizophilus]